ncbi:GNAT family N-acetyltransferase [Microbacterium hominis]|uniref:GNAT family N-acetyltransferase n=1 Tax=Microbacterium hominis TaxID=162426 RepID=UPI0020B76DB5|nr:GNAT family N-acetyltransferase [Microbacterium hominis]
MSFTLRAPVPDDAGALVDLHVATWREAYAHLLPEGFFTPEYIAGRRRMWDLVLAHPGDDARIRLAEAGDELIGFGWAGTAIAVAGKEPTRQLQLFALYVRAAHYGTGVGQALLDDVVGPGPALLWVAAQNPRAIAFYRRNGFAFDGVEVVDPGAPWITDARMVR